MGSVGINAEMEQGLQEMEQGLQNEKKRAAEMEHDLQNEKKRAAEERMAMEQEKKRLTSLLDRADERKRRNEQAAADSMVAELKAEIARLQQSRQGRERQLKDAADFAADFVDVQDDAQDESEAIAFILATFPSFSTVFRDTLQRIYVARRSVFGRAR